ncbi:Asp-tRNA(Asn)/Glu-tRNA(Gln) amidotransferase subunit GatA [Candidatus Poribacteria bacterium]|nr:Asp-tRNA(Asn)/Glu-tRNA(Gln) amidotransferase subunit GatA [Candidatus Poribacteria bacterium]
MPSDALCDRTAHEIGDLIRSRQASAVEVTESVLSRIRSANGDINAYLTLMEDSALATARDVDARIGRGESLPPLAGVPVGLKDILCVEGVRTTCASKILESFIAPYDATVVAKLKAQRAVLVGKLNMDEFAMGSSNENSAFGVVRNPWDRTRAPGGSSGGSAAAVASGMAALTLGSDTGGSIRQPASLCGIVGMKPTYGRVSRFGLIAFASSLDQIGPFARNVTDTALMLGAISGHDPYDSTSADLPVPDYTQSLIPDVKGLRIGIPREYFIDGMDPEVEASVRAAVRQFEALGAEVEECSLPHTEYAVAVYYIVATAEASSNLARYDGVRYGFRADDARGLIDMYRKTRSQGFGPEVKRRIMLGTYALSSGYYDAYYLKAQKVRTLVKRDFDEAFERFDLIVTPTSPTAAFGLGEKTDDPLQMYLSDIFTISANLAGIPGISIPCGSTSGSLPIGVQVLAKPFDEPSLLRAAFAFEQSTDYHTRRPRLGEGSA